MNTLIPEIVSAEKLDNGVAVTFSDGGSTLFPADLLYAARNLADIMNEKTIEDLWQNTTPGE